MRSLQNDFCWASRASLRDVCQQSIQVNILSKEGQSTSLPLSILISASPHIQSILSPTSCCLSSSVTISLPSASFEALELLVQILCKGETDECRGLESMMNSLREVEELIAVLGIEINKANLYLSLSKEVGVKEECNVDLDNDEAWELEQYNDCPVDMNSNIGNSIQAGIIKDCEVKLSRIDEPEGENVCSDFQEQLPQPFIKLNKVNSLKCEICAASISSYQSLRVHNSEIHGFEDYMVLNEKRYRSEKNMCPVCNLKFSSWGMMMKHFHQKHQDDTKVTGYQCKDCDMKCNNIANLQRHRQARHRDLEFVDVSNNTSVFDGVVSKDILVTECGFIATNQEILSFHCQDFHHKSTTWSSAEKKVPSSQYSVIKCEECNHTFLSKTGLREHIERAHEGIKYGCGDCEYTAGYRSSLRKHCRRTGHNSSLICRINS